MSYEIADAKALAFEGRSRWDGRDSMHLPSVALFAAANLNVLDVLGYTAATLTTCSFIPQAIKTIKTRDTSGISLGMYVAFTLGVICWLIYGIIAQAWPVTVANAITTPLAATILVLKVRHG